jgi:hypothetical protein
LEEPKRSFFNSLCGTDKEWVERERDGYGGGVWVQVVGLPYNGIANYCSADDPSFLDLRLLEERPPLEVCILGGMLKISWREEVWDE